MTARLALPRNRNHAITMLGKRDSVKVGNNTYLVRDLDGNPFVRYHYTAAVAYRDDSIVVHDGNWQTVTTKQRINDALSAVGCDWRVCQKDWTWYVRNWRTGQTFPYSNGMTFAKIGGDWRPAQFEAESDVAAFVETA